MTQQAAIKHSLGLIFEGIRNLHDTFGGRRKFTIDGRLVGDIGEVIAELHYELILDETSQPTHDATTQDGRRVQVKATFKESLTLSSVPDLYLGIKLHADGTFEEIFNGPGQLIAKRYALRKGIGDKLLSFPIKELRLLQSSVADVDRVRRRPN